MDGCEPKLQVAGSHSLSPMPNLILIGSGGTAGGDVVLCTRTTGKLSSCGGTTERVTAAAAFGSFQI